MAKANKALVRAKRLQGQALKRARLYKDSYKVYAPSVGTTLTVAAGGAIAGAVDSGAVGIPSNMGGVSSKLLIGGLLSAYAIYASGDANPDNDKFAKIAQGLGSGMIAVWSADYTAQMLANAAATQGE